MSAKFYTEKQVHNLEALFNRMKDNGFIIDPATTFDEFKSYISESQENWFSNGVVEVKLFTGDYRGITLSNFRRILNPHVDLLFEVA